MNKFSYFLTNFFMTAFRHIGSIIISIVLIIVGTIWSKICLYIGLFLILSNIIVAFVGAVRMQSLDDEPDFNEIMEKLSADPDTFFSDIMQKQEQNKQLHKKDLLTLSDDDLFETVYLQNLDIVSEADEAEKELQLLTGARKTVYILSLFDSEIQNGGLCQFFVNSSRVVAPFVSDTLKAVNASEHLKLFEDFIITNSIDTSNLESFKVSNIRGYKKQSKRFDFDSFDTKYYELPELQQKVVKYIKDNIDEF